MSREFPDELVNPVAARNRANIELSLRVGQVAGAAIQLQNTGTCAIVAVSDAPLEGFKQGISNSFLTKGGTPKTLWLPADGNIQNYEDGDEGWDQEQATIRAISELRRLSGFVVVAFEGVDYSEKARPGSPAVITRLTSIIEDEDRRLKEDTRRQRSLRDLGTWYGGKHKREFAVLLLGCGEPRDLLSHPEYDKSLYSDFLASFTARLALLKTGELAVGFPDDEPEELRADRSNDKAT